MRVYSARLGITLFLLSAPVGLAAQGRPGGGGGAGGGGRTGSSVPSYSRPSIPPRTGVPAPDVSFPGPTFLSGKVVTDDGTPLTDSAVIQTVCLGTVRNEAYSDSRGNFSFDLQNRSTGVIQDVEENSGAGVLRGSSRSGRRRDVRPCSLRAVLPGFRSEMIELASKAGDSGTADVGTLVLHRMAKVEGLTISATTAAAPAKARKEFEKGREDEGHKKWDSAQQHFAKAVEIYPKYAVAWNELGQVQWQKNDAAAAENSFHQAIAADAKFVNPYAGLVEIALKGQQWKQVAELTDKITALNPVDFPQYWFDSALANYFLENFDAAQKSAERGMSVDAQHRVPRIEYILGIILAKKGDYSGALTHVQNYLRMVPTSSDRSVIEKQIAELQRLATTSQLKPQ